MSVVRTGPKIRASEVVGQGYDEFWTCRKFYRILKGSKGSKKSKTTALWYIWHMMKYPQANVLVIRKVYATLRQSCYTDLLWAIDKLQVQKYWKATTAPLQLEYVPTGQVILFRGLDEAQKLASIMVRKGILCWVWFEEFYEITNEEEFNKIEFSIRGEIPKGSGLWKQITATFNPWSEHTWIKARFFDEPHDDVFTMTTTYRVNEFLGDDDRKRYEDLYVRDPRAARVICDGDWGIAEGLIYTDWEEQLFDPRYLLLNQDIKTSFGLDFGYAVSENAFVALAVDLKTYTMWIFDEMYENGMTNLDIAKRITEMGYAKEMIWADAAEPKSIYELQQGFMDEKDGELVRFALPNIRPALKGPDSVNNGIARMQQFHIIVHPRCVNTLRELSTYHWDVDKDGNFTGKPSKEDDHCLVAGTKVITDRGEVPIEDIQVGDMVLTHLGLREVTASGVTRPLPAEIWRMTLSDGTIVEGTADHPVPTVDGLKCIQSISNSDRVVVCLDQRNAVNWEGLRSSNMMGCSGTGIPTPPDAQTDCISSITQPISTDMSGKNTTDQSQKDAISIMSMEIRSTTTSPISDASPLSNMQENTPTQMSTGTSYPSRCAEILPGRTPAEPGILQRQAMSGMSSTGNASQPICNQSNTPAYSVAGHTSQSHSGLPISSAPTPANPRTDAHPGSMTRTEFVRSVTRHSGSISTVDPEPVPDHVQGVSQSSMGIDCFTTLEVVSVENTGRFEFVYDLTVDEAHDFFANGVLVLNCMDAARYGLSAFFMRGHGYVAEARGEEVPATPVVGAPAPASSPAPRKYRRVFAT